LHKLAAAVVMIAMLMVPMLVAPVDVFAQKPGPGGSGGSTSSSGITITLPRPLNTPSKFPPPPGLCEQSGFVASSRAAGNNEAAFDLYDMDGNLLATAHLNAATQPNLVAEMRSNKPFYIATVIYPPPCDVFSIHDIQEVRSFIIF
jgi:hypothetical protein